MSAEIFEIPPLQGWFVPRQVPEGSAAEDIKVQWVDVPLPLRLLTHEETPDIQLTHGLGDITDVHIVEGGIEVYAFDAVKALTLFNRRDAAAFWYDSLWPDEVLVFRAHEGAVYSTTVLQRILPGIELFDEIEART